MNDKGKQFYEYLLSKNIEVPDNYEEFQSAMQDSATASQFHSFVISKGITVPESVDEFSSVFSIQEAQEVTPDVKKKEQTEPTQTPNQVLPDVPPTPTFEVASMEEDSVSESPTQVGVSASTRTDEIEPQQDGVTLPTGPTGAMQPQEFEGIAVTPTGASIDLGAQYREEKRIQSERNENIKKYGLDLTKGQLTDVFESPIPEEEDTESYLSKQIGRVTSSANNIANNPKAFGLPADISQMNPNEREEVVDRYIARNYEMRGDGVNMNESELRNVFNQKFDQALAKRKADRDIMLAKESDDELLKAGVSEEGLKPYKLAKQKQSDVASLNPNETKLYEANVKLQDITSQIKSITSKYEKETGDKLISKVGGKNLDQKISELNSEGDNLTKLQEKGFTDQASLDAFNKRVEVYNSSLESINKEIESEKIKQDKIQKDYAKDQETLSKLMGEYQSQQEVTKSLMGNIREDGRIMVDYLTGQHVDKLSDDDDADITEAVNAQIVEFNQPTYKDQLDDIYIKVGLRDQRHREFGNEATDDVTIGTTGMARDFSSDAAINRLRSLGYEEVGGVGEVTFKNVPIREQASSYVINVLDESKRDRADRWLATNKQNLIEKEALKNMVLLNIDPTFEKGVVAGLKRGVEVFTEELLPSYASADKALGFTSKRKLADAALPLLQEEGIELTENQKKTLERTFGEQATEATFGMIPFIGKVVAVNYMLGPVRALSGFDDLIKVLKSGDRVSSLSASFLEALFEEGAMQAADAPTGMGFGFSVGGKLFKAINLDKFPLRPTGDWARSNKALDAFWSHAIKGTSSAEFASVVESMIKDFEGGETFKNFAEENYSDLSDVTQRMLVNAISFSALGVKDLGFFIQKGKSGFNIKNMETARDEAQRKGYKEEADILTKYINEYYAGKPGKAQPASYNDMKLFVENVPENESTKFTVSSLEEVPAEFRDRAKKNESVETEVDRTFLGIPLGKKKVNSGESYSYELTGEEIRELFNKKKEGKTETEFEEEFDMSQKAEEPPVSEEVMTTAPTETVKRKGRVTKFSAKKGDVVGEIVFEDGTKKELTQEEYDALGKQEGLFDVEVPVEKKITKEEYEMEMAKKLAETQPTPKEPAAKEQLALGEGKVEPKEAAPTETPTEGDVLQKQGEKEVVKVPEAYKEAMDEYKQSDLGGSKTKQKLVEQAETSEGKRFVEDAVTELPKNEDGTITVYRVGSMQEGHNPVTIYKEMADSFVGERKKRGLSSDIIEVRVNPEDISVVVPGVEGEVLVNVNRGNKLRIKANTKSKKYTEKELEKKKSEIKDKLEEAKTARDKYLEDKKSGKLPASLNNLATEKLVKDKVKNLEWQLSKLEDTKPTSVEEFEAEVEPIELKEGEIDITTVFKNPVEKNNEQAVAASNEFKDKAGEYDEGVNDPKFKEENTTVEEISVDDIVPTQERLFEENLKSPSEGEPLVMKVGDKYYVEDGHHRIGNGINADNQTVSVRVYESDKAKQDAIQEQEAADVPKVEQPEAVQEVEGEVREPAREAEETKDTKKAEEAEITEEEKVKAAKENLNNVWEKWKQSQKNLGVAFDPKSKANEDMELLEAFVSYIQAIGAKTAKDIQKAFNDFTGGEATLDEAGAEFVAESVKEPVTKKTDKELSREVTFTNIYDIIEKVEKRTPKKANPKEVNKRAYQNAYDYLLKSDWFASATDTEQTEAIDDLKKLTKQRRESSPSAKKILGIDSTKEKISVDQKTVRSWMMQDLAKGYKLGKRDAKKVMSAMARLKNSLENELVGAMREIQSSGKLSKKQVDAIVNKFQKTNVFNPDAVESFLNYMQKVVDKADHVDAVSKANSTRKQIKRRMKNKDVDNNLVQAAKEFAKINPSKVDDIDAYNQLAEKIKEGLGFSINSKQGVKFRSAFDISTVEEYSELELKRQKLASDAAFEEMFKDMFGSDLGMTVSQMRDFYAELDKETEKDEVKDKETRAKKAMDSAVKAFDTYSAIINEMLESGVDSFTGEKLDIDSKTEELIKEFMDSDITKLPLKDAIRAVDALNNFVVNQTTGGLEAIVRKRRGESNVKKLVNDGVKSFKLKLPFGSGKTRVSNIVGAYLNSFASLPNLMDNLFGGVRKALKVENAIGFSDVVNGRAAANKKANQVLEQFLDKFKSKKANNEDFNTAANMTERGLLGFMRRTSLSTDEKLRKAEFERRKNLIKESIEKMMKFGDEADFNKAQIYMEAYNKLLEDSNSIEDVESKADPVNKEAVEWWSEKFNEILPELTETSINVYNTVLENESNYNPDVFKRLNEQESELTGLDEDSYNSGSGNQKVYDKKNPMLMRVKKPSSLPKGRYVSLDFDVNNFNSYESALVDINTASAIQQLKGALESDAFMQLVPDYRDRKILKDRITTYVSQIRGKGGIPRGQLWNEVNRIANMFSRVGTATSLGGLLQPAKQTLPVFVNTLVNSGMDPRVFQSIAYVFNKDISNAINNSGMPIANRGALSETTLDDIDKLSDKLEETKGEGLYNGIKRLQDMWMKKFLQEPDAFIARASFLVYYKQELKRKGIDPSKINWKDHKWNKDAANFAQRMVDRQQNVSDSDLQGLFLTERGGAAPIIRKILLPFQNFVLNQKNRMYADVKALRYGSKEDKSIAIKSLLGLSAEWALFTLISMGIQEGMYMTAEALISQFKGDEDDEEAKKKRAKEKERRRKMYIKSMSTSAAKDFLSPLPVIDEALITALNYGLEESGASIDKGDENSQGSYRC